MVQIRQATQDDQKHIRQMVYEARLDPSSLNWRHFLIAEDDTGVVGIGQVKRYPGCRELGSLVVKKGHRRQGVASQLIAALEASTDRPLYLLCESRLEQFYTQFGYAVISWWAAPLFLKLKLLPTYIFRLFGVRVLVMLKP